VAQHVAAPIDKAEAAVTELARETIKQASEEIGEGKHPERSTQITLGNFMIAAAKGVQSGLAPETVVDGVKDGIKDGHKTIAKWAMSAERLRRASQPMRPRQRFCHSSSRTRLCCINSAP
jgi:hypothetical protein